VTQIGARRTSGDELSANLTVRRRLLPDTPGVRPS
jgi:hypothetical protein